MGFLLPFYLGMWLLVNEGSSLIAVAVAFYCFAGILGRG